MCRLGCRMELLQSRARANVPTALEVKGGGGADTGAEGVSGGPPTAPLPHPPGPSSPCHHQKLVDLPVGQGVIRVPHLHLHLLLVSVV